MAATLRDVKKRAKELGAKVEVEVNGDFREVLITAPDGMRWEIELHQFVDSVHKDWPNDYDDMLERMSRGPEICDDPHCEWCHPDD